MVTLVNYITHGRAIFKPGICDKFNKLAPVRLLSYVGLGPFKLHVQLGIGQKSLFENQLRSPTLLKVKGY